MSLADELLADLDEVGGEADEEEEDARVSPGEINVTDFKVVFFRMKKVSWKQWKGWRKWLICPTNQCEP